MCGVCLIMYHWVDDTHKKTDRIGISYGTSASDDGTFVPSCRLLS